MLQHNVGERATRRARRAHVAHAALISLHAVCCGLPALALVAAALSGVTSSSALLSDSFVQFHELMHAHEVWILIVSAALVVTGGLLELAARRAGHAHGRAFPWLFAFSTFCFLANVAIILAHRG